LAPTVEEESRAQWANKSEEIKRDAQGEGSNVAEDVPLADPEDNETE